MKLIPVLILFVAVTTAADASTLESPLTTTTRDGVTIHGEAYFADLDDDRPLILLFHQGGSNGRGEYGEFIAPWLNDAGFRAIAWDVRAGGDRLGSTNRTMAGMDSGTPAGYCDAAADIAAALDYVADAKLAERVVLWGSSFSAALVFEAAARHPDRVQGVIAFSPAAGGPLENCRARMWIDDVDAPMLVLRPASEMERESSREQRDLMVDAGADFQVVDHGVHGSSMLVDARTRHNMAGVRAGVIDWIERVTVSSD